VSDDQAQIRALLADVTAGYRARDAGQIVASYAPDIVMYSLATPLRSRRGDLLDIGGGRKVDLTTAEGVQVWLDGFGDAPFDYEIRDLEVEAGGDVAYAHGLARMGPEGVFSMWLRVTFGLRKTEGRWQIADLHGSVPFYMDQTFKAAVDLQP
jgi:ketosteroid isomerase-like protein